MYVRDGLTLRGLLVQSRFILPFSAAYATVIVALHELAAFQVLALPIQPVATIGIAVSLYLGFKSTQAYGRWWEARTIWGRIVNDSRTWCNAVRSMALASDGTPLDAVTQHSLIGRHLAWVNLLADELRRRSGVASGDPSLAPSCLDHLDEAERTTIAGTARPSIQVLRLQGDALGELARQGRLDAFRHLHLGQLLEQHFLDQGGCERINNTPFPRPVDLCGRVFTWIFIALLPMAFIDVFEGEVSAHGLSNAEAMHYLFVAIPFSVVISWIFYFMEKVSSSMEDPFCGGPNDVPVLQLCRVIEIDLAEMMGQTPPAPLAPAGGVMY